MLASNDKENLLFKTIIYISVDDAKGWTIYFLIFQWWCEGVVTNKSQNFNIFEFLIFII